MMLMIFFMIVISASLMDNYVDLQEFQLNFFRANWTHLKEKQQILIIPITFYLGGMRAFIEKKIAILTENLESVQPLYIICFYTLVGLGCFVIMSRFLPLNLLSIFAILLNYLTLIFISVLKDDNLINNLESQTKIYTSKLIQIFFFIFKSISFLALLNVELIVLEINLCVLYAYLFMRSSSISFSNYFFW